MYRGFPFIVETHERNEVSFISCGTEFMKHRFYAFENLIACDIVTFAHGRHVAPVVDNGIVGLYGRLLVEHYDVPSSRKVSVA
jgi:hypothetical protein